MDERRLVIVSDIDGTLANNDHRRHFMEQKPKDWDAFYGAMDADSLHAHVADTIAALIHDRPSRLTILCTGRPEEWRPLTLGWLRRHCVPCHRLYMRATGDYRSDVIVKREMLEKIRADGYEPYVVFDDRNSVVAMWRSEGIPCFQVADGDF